MTTSGTAILEAGDEVRLLTPPIWAGQVVKVKGVHRHYAEQKWYWVIFERPGGESLLFDRHVELIKKASNESVHPQDGVGDQGRPPPG